MSRQSKFLSLTGLKELIDTKNSSDAIEFLENISKFFEDTLSKAEIDYAIEVIFNLQTGTSAFLNRSIREQKLFSSANVKIFNIWIKIFENYGKEIKFDTYIEHILQCCMQFALSNQVSAKEREKSIVVIQEIFKNKLVEELDASEVVKKLLDIFNLKTNQSTFILQTFKLFGIIARDSPENLTENAIQVRDVLLKRLEETLLNENDFAANTMLGAMEGFDGYLSNFAPSKTDDFEICKRIYVCVKKLSDPLTTNIKAPFRAALDVFTHHSTIFSKFIYNDFKYWHNCLLNWYKSKSYEDRRKGIYAVNSFHMALEEEFREQKDSIDKNVLVFLINYFREILESTSSTSHEIRIAIRGFGMMALYCKMYSPDNLEHMLSLVIQRSELISITEDNNLRSSLEHFPDYIESLSQIILNIGDEYVGKNLSTTIQNILIRLIRDFHYLSKAHSNLVVNSIYSAFNNLSLINGPLFEDVSEKVILQGVIWTCSHKLRYDAKIDWQSNIDWKDNITYENYMPLWKGLLDETTSSFENSIITKRIFNCTISALYIILEKLNLRTKRRIFQTEDGKDQELFFCDPNIDLCPERPEDFYIFFNIIDFYREIFYTKFNSEYFRDWLNGYCNLMIKYSIENPLISGFLRLLEYGLIIGNRLQYFNNTESIHEFDNLQMQLSYFLKNLSENCQRVSGELQIAHIELILNYPTKMYADYLIDLVPIYQLAFDLGKSMITIAKLAIKSLERLYDEFFNNRNDLEKFFQQILPKLDTYLQSFEFNEEFAAQMYTYKNRRKTPKKSLTELTTSELNVVQKSILSFLGKIDPHDALHLVAKKNVNSEDDYRYENDDGTEYNLVKWTVEQNIKLTLNFPDIKTEIYLDAFVPRICQLAVKSSDRKTKIAACEILHTLVLYLLGARNHNGIIWKNLCSIILLLGSDSDTTVKQMFEPLLMQLMHYMSKPNKLYEGADTLMEALMQGISNNKNFAVRDLSAICLREFVQWCIKQISPQQLQVSAVSIEMILEQLKIYSFDSNESRRNGAALAFNNLYRHLREEEAICDLYFIDLLYTFCMNYKLSEELNTILTEQANPALEQISLSIDHVVRVLKERNNLFNKINVKRQIPQEIGGNGMLKDVLIFLLNESPTKLMSYRRKCLNICVELSPYVLNISSLSQFLKIHVQNDVVCKICEGPTNGCGIQMKPTLYNFLDLQLNPQFVVSTWLQYFLSALDCYVWFLNDYGLYDPKVLFSKGNYKIFISIDYYFMKICWSNMYEIVESINPSYLNATDTTAKNFNIKEINKIDSIKCIICIQIVEFFTCILNSNCGNDIPKEFWENESGNNFIKFISQIIYEPNYLCFDFTSYEISSRLPPLIEKLLKALLKKCPNENFKGNLGSKILMILTSRIREYSEKAHLVLGLDRINQHDSNIVKGIIFIMKNIKLFENHKYYAENMNYLKISSEKLLNDLFLGVKEKIFNKNHTIIPKQDVKTFANNLMKLSFSISEHCDNLINYLLNEDMLIVSGMSTKIQHGEHFFCIFKQSIFNQCKSEFIVIFVPKLFNSIENNNFSQIIKILEEITVFTYKYRQHDQDTLETLVKTLLVNLENILVKHNGKNDILIITDFLLHIIEAQPISWQLKVYKIYAPALESWIIEKIKDISYTSEEKSRILTLLPLLIDANDITDSVVTEALLEFQHQHLPLNSSEFKQNSLDESRLKISLKSLLDTMIKSKSLILLNFIINSTASDEKHILEYMIREYLKKFIDKLNDYQQEQCIKHVFELILKTNCEPQIRLTILHRFLLPIIRNCKENSIISTYINIFNKISQLIDAKYNFAKFGWNVDHGICNRTIGFHLIEEFFGCVRKEKYYQDNSDIIKAFLPNETMAGTFLSTITRKAFYVRKDVFVTDNLQTTEFFRLYQCAGYRTLCAVICNTQEELKFYNKFIFEENLIKNEIIWQKLIDCSNDKKYLINGQELENHPKIKERFVSIRRLNPRSIPNFYDNEVMSSKYLQTQNVFASSLSQDVNKIDLNFSMLRSDAEAKVQMDIQKREVQSVHLEHNCLNKHEIMPILCAVIFHMHENNITPHIADPVVSKKSYPWVVSIANAMDSQNPINVRIFLAQLVDNCRHVFEPYTHLFYKPILKLLSDVYFDMESNLNYFFTDLLVLLLSWTSKKLYEPKTPEESYLTSNLLKFMMKNCWCSSRAILKFNLELIQAMINSWKHILTVPHQLLLDMITATESIESKENERGLVLIGIILSNNITPWTKNLKILFLRAIFNNLNNNNSEIYQPAAYVLGMTLSTLKCNSELEHIDSIENDLVGKLKALLNKKENKKEKMFLDIIYNVQKNYPEILDKFREIISFKIPTALGKVKKMYLEMILTRLDYFNTDEIYSTIVSIGIRKLLKTDDFQLLSLHILNKSIPKLKSEEIYDLFPKIEEICTQSTKFDCRDVTYEILIFIAQNSNDSGLVRKSDILLLNGLLDINSQIQKRIFQYWSQNSKLTSTTYERFINLISNYNDKSEQEFLGFCTQLLLDPIIQNPESKLQIFPYENEDNFKLDEYTIDTISRTRTTNLPPLFASINHQNWAMPYSQMCKFIRKTVEIDDFFEPTQDPIKMNQVQKNFTIQTHNSLPFNIQAQILDRRSQKVNQFEKTEEIDEINNSNSINTFRRRFLRSKEDEKRQHTLNAIDNSYKRLKEKVSIQNETKIVLYRRYRHGDYPDLLINNLAFLLPFQALVKLDRIVARQMFVSIFNSISRHLEKELSKKFVTQVGNQIEEIFKRFRKCDSIIFATFLEIALVKPDVFDIKPEVITMISKSNNMLTIGAIYLESRLNSWDNYEMECSNRTNTTITLLEKNWLELADIYNTLAEYDIVAGLFSDKLDTDPRLVQAIELKMNGHYSEAQELLLKVIERQRSIEQNYSYNCYYEILQELCNWSLLSQNIHSQMDDNLEELWKDEYDTTFLLPKLMQAELNLTLSSNHNTDFLQTLEVWLNDTVKSDHLKMFFCEELMMFNIATQNFSQARVYFENHVKKFLMEWGVITTHYSKLRQNFLLNTQKCIEIDYYAFLLMKNVDNENVLNILIKKWTNCNIELNDSLSFWNSIITYRKCIADLVLQLNIEKNSEKSMELKNVIHKMNIKLFNAAIHQKNTGLSEQMLESLSPLQHIQEDNLYLEYEMAKIKSLILNSYIVKEDSIKIEVLKDAWLLSNKTLKDKNLMCSHSLNIELLQRTSKICSEILKIIPSAKINVNTLGILNKLSGENDELNLNERIFMQSYQLLLNSSSAAEKLLLKEAKIETKDMIIYAKTNYQLAQFCYDFYSLQTSENISLELQKTLIKSIFNAMKFNSVEAKHLFPCILAITTIDSDHDFNDYFKACSSNVPEWMFLDWLPQILSRLTLTSESYLDNIIVKISKSYPNALYYPFNAWYKMVQVEDDVDQPQLIRNDIRQCLENLNNPIMEKFIKACKSLNLPQFQLSTMINQLQIDFKKLTQETYIKRIDKILEQLYKEDSEFHGNHYQVILKYKEKLNIAKLFNVNNDSTKIMEHLKNISTDLNSLQVVKKMRIQNICPWFQKYHWCGETEFLELPGQYAGNKKPFLENHVKIVRFCDNIYILQSLRHPIKIKMYGSDGNNYNFLLKFGEDLKQDQRIQQILKLMSSKINENLNCQNHNLFIQTYQVIPIDLSFGILRWINNTTTIDEFFKSCYARREPNSNSILMNTVKAHKSFIEKSCQYSMATNTVACYGSAVTKYSREIFVQHFRTLENNIDLNILKYALIDISISPESFYVLRNNFVTSLATMNISNWILGIGDRHLENILINVKNGNLTGIDFGHVFGSGTRDLPIPELVPFRLTPHFIYALNPMGTSGLLYKSMVHTLNVLRESKKMLLACMKVFVNESTIKIDQETNDAKFELELQNRIDITKCKLDGYNPMHLLMKDIKKGRISLINKIVAEGYLKIIQGHEQFNIRSRTAESNLSTEDQVKCLIDLATDPAILGCAWEGFQAWI